MKANSNINKTYNVRDGPQQDGTWQYGPNAGCMQSTILTFSGVSEATEEFTLGETVYQFLASATAATAGKVKVVVGTDADTSAQNVATAINANDPYYKAIYTGTTGEVLIMSRFPGMTGKIGQIDITGDVLDTDYITIGQRVYEINSTGGVTAGRIAVAVTALTKLVVAAALTAVINNDHPYVYAVNRSSTDGRVDLFARIPYLRYGSTAGSGVNYPVVPYLELAEAAQNTTITANSGMAPCAEAAAGLAITNGAFSPSTTEMVGGVPAVAGKVSYIKRDITTADATQGYVYLPMDYTPSGWIVQVFTSTGKETQKADFTIFDGVTTSIPGLGGGLKITKGTNHPFANGDVLMVIAWE